MCLKSPKLLAHAELLAQISTQLRETQVYVADFIVNNVEQAGDPSKFVGSFIKFAKRHNRLFFAILKREDSTPTLPAAVLVELLEEFGEMNDDFWKT